MNYYGYIKNTDLHTHLESNVYWSFTVIDINGSETKYSGIKSSTDFNDSNIESKGDKVEFLTWFRSENTQIIE